MIAQCCYVCLANDLSEQKQSLKKDNENGQENTIIFRENVRKFLCNYSKEVLFFLFSMQKILFYHYGVFRLCTLISKVDLKLLH